MDVLVVYCPSLILLDVIAIPTIAEYCGKKHRVLATAVGNDAMKL
jgi:hypothetical protein